MTFAKFVVEATKQAIYHMTKPQLHFTPQTPNLHDPQGRIYLKKLKD